MTLWFPLATACTGISKVSLKILLEHSRKKPICIHNNHFLKPKRNKCFPKAHHAVWSDVIQFKQMADSGPNPVINSRHVGILRYSYRMRCPLFPKSLGIPRQMGYLTQLFEATVVSRENTNSPIDNVHRLL